MKFPPGVHQISKMPKGNNIAGKFWHTNNVILPDGSVVEGRYVVYESKERYGGFVYFYVNDFGYRAFFDRFAVVVRRVDTFQDGTEVTVNDIHFDLTSK